MSEIINVQAREILDSRGNPTVEVDVMTACGAFGRVLPDTGQAQKDILVAAADRAAACRAAVQIYAGGCDGGCDGLRRISGALSKALVA